MINSGTVYPNSVTAVKLTGRIGNTGMALVHGVIEEVAATLCAPPAPRDESALGLAAALGTSGGGGGGGGESGELDGGGGGGHFHRLPFDKRFNQQRSAAVGCNYRHCR